jgi:hypothetical protein
VTQVNCIRQLSTFVNIIKAAYLGLDSLLLSDAIADSLTDPALKTVIETLRATSTIIFTESDKEQLDMQVQVYISGCTDRIDMVKKRVASIEDALKDSNKNLATTLLIEHYRSVVWIIERKLVDASAVHRKLQDMRLEQQAYKQQMLVIYLPTFFRTILLTLIRHILHSLLPSPSVPGSPLQKFGSPAARNIDFNAIYAGNFSTPIYIDYLYKPRFK